MMIASDLDRTLIYSMRAIQELGGPPIGNLKPVERKEKEWIGFMTESSFAALKKLCSRHLFLPVTTRTVNQFKRITIFQKDISLSYAITDNGANILWYGERLTEWTETISAKMRLETATMQEIFSLLRTEDVHVNGERRQAENLFFYYVLNSKISLSEKKRFSEKVMPYGWRVSLQGRKLYFIPRAINKGDALKFICEKEGQSAEVGAGDSVLDWDFLKNCKHRLVPLHGELVRENGITDFSVTKKRGILAGEEILHQCLLL